MQMRYAVAINGSNRLVAGFDSQFQIVVHAGSLAFVKTWATRERAETWAKAHQGKGYGLDTFKIIEIRS